MNWNDIKSAPKDGTPVLLFCEDKIDRYYVSGNKAPRMTIGFFGATNEDYGRRGVWCSVEAKEEMWGMGGEMTGPMTSTDLIEVSPTHWMPLPEPPK
jgi:hypothetical protein